MRIIYFIEYVEKAKDELPLNHVRSQGRNCAILFDFDFTIRQNK